VIAHAWQTIPEGAWSGHVNHLNFGGHHPMDPSFKLIVLNIAVGL